MTVSSAGDARSLEGGLLLLTPLYGPDGQIYAQAQGPLVLGGYAVTRERQQQVGELSHHGANSFAARWWSAGCRSI